MKLMACCAGLLDICCPALLPPPPATQCLLQVAAAWPPCRPKLRTVVLELVFACVAIGAATTTQAMAIACMLRVAESDEGFIAS